MLHIQLTTSTPHCSFKCFKNSKTRQNLEASYIGLCNSDLSEQKDFERLALFKNSVT